MPSEYRGDLVLHPAGIEDRRPIYEWLARSDITCSMIGPPTFPEKPIPTWEEFLADYQECYFNDLTPNLGRCFLIQVEGASVGQINYNDIEVHDGMKLAELDIWLRSKEYCGKGYGVKALVKLCQFLLERLEVNEFLVQPSARNPQAIRAYEKAGFEKVEATESLERNLGNRSDYYDSVWMIKHATVGNC